jgi:hypothetical protein
VFCPGTPLTLSGKSVTDEGVYFWNTNDSSKSIVVTNRGDYSLTITNYCGKSTTTLSPSYYPIKAGFSLNKKEGMFPLDLVAKNNSDGAERYKWLLDGEQIDTLFNLKYRVIPFGNHEIKLVAFDNFGCADTAIDSIVVLQNPNMPPLLCDFRVDPNPALDHFTISALNNDKQVREIRIFNSLGQVVFQEDISHWKENPFYFEHQFTNLPSGTYLIGLYCESETKFRKVVVSE